MYSVSLDRVTENSVFNINIVDFGKKYRTMGRVGKKFKKFCNWAFSRKSGKTQQNQSLGELEHQRCFDGEAGPSNVAFISHIHTGAGVSPSPAPHKAEKKLKRFRKWLSRKFKKTTTRAPQTQPSSPQTQRSPDGEAACVSPRPVQDEGVNNRCVSIQTPVKTPSTETEQPEDTECWHLCVSSLTPADISESDRASLQSWHSCASSLGTSENSESDYASLHSSQCCGSSLDTSENGESDRASVHSAPPCVSSPTADPSVSKESTASSSDNDFWKAEKKIPVNLDSNPGDINDEYRVKSIIGKGGFGSVSAGVRRSDSRKVAIKNVSKTKARRTMKILPYEKTVPQEVGLMYLMSKGPYVPQIIQLLDWYETPSQYTLVLESPNSCMDLQTFAWKHRKKMTESVARLVMHQVVAAAIECCERDVYHSDIKPENVLINPHTFQIKLIDFGVGRIMNSEGYSTFCGTKPYAPPEFSDCKKFHAKPATVYSIGVMLYRLLHRKYPRRELTKIVARTWERDKLSKECIDMICSCLQRDPQQRIPLEEILQHNWFQVLILKPSKEKKTLKEKIQSILKFR
ncbi:uncharacterized protein [Danio rerio]|uniref:non-specific serine/threonine protein kinase n=1 Tax=Danio rerio TaxID=7955 RepID=A0AB32TWK2_DANRE